MVEFDKGEYTSQVCDMSKVQVTSKTKRCGLMMAGDQFHRCVCYCLCKKRCALFQQPLKAASVCVSITTMHVEFFACPLSLS